MNETRKEAIMLDALRKIAAMTRRRKSISADALWIAREALKLVDAVDRPQIDQLAPNDITVAMKLILKRAAFATIIEHYENTGSWYIYDSPSTTRTIKVSKPQARMLTRIYRAGYLEATVVSRPVGEPPYLRCRVSELGLEVLRG